MRNLRLIRAWVVAVTVLGAATDISMATWQQDPQRNAGRRPGRQDTPVYGFLIVSLVFLTRREPTGLRAL